MNYIKLLEDEAIQLRKQGIISLEELGLYLMLVSTANGFKWKNPFDGTNTFICGLIGKNETTLIRMRNRLKQVGLIDFEPGQKGKPTRYYLTPPENTLEYTGGNTPNLPVKTGVNARGKTIVKTGVETKVNSHDNNKQNKSKLNHEEGRSGEGLFSERAVVENSPEPPNANLFRSFSLEEILQDAWLQMNHIPLAYVEVWFAKYSSEGWMTGGAYPKPIPQPAHKIVQHWKDGKIMPDLKTKFGEERAVTVPQWNGKKNGYDPNEPLTLEFEGKTYTYKRGDCDYNGNIVNQDHPNFNEIQMAQLLGGGF